MNKQLNLGLGYECKRLCERVLCYRLFPVWTIWKSDGVSGVIAKCSLDGSVSGYDHTVWAPKGRLLVYYY